MKTTDKVNSRLSVTEQRPLFGKPKTGRPPRLIDALDTDGHPFLTAIARDWLNQPDDRRTAAIIDAAHGLISGKGEDLVKVWRRERAEFWAKQDRNQLSSQDSNQ